MAGILGDDDDNFGASSSGSEQNYTAQLGRISGKLLSDNLQRNGIDIAVETDLLYLDVTNKKISINTSPPVYDLDVNANIKTTDLTITGTAYFEPSGLRISGNTFTTQVGGIDIILTGPSPELLHERLITSNLEFNGNRISSFSDSDINLDPNGSGTVEIVANTYITGNLDVSGNIRMDGNLTGLGTLTLGDTIYDTVTVNTDFTQSIIPGDDNLYDLGSISPSNKRWAQIHATGWEGIGNLGDGITTSYVTISDQLRLDGVNRQIITTQSNDDVLLNSDTGLIYLESIGFDINNNDIINTLNSPITLTSTGIGYVRFTGIGGIVVPSGTDAERRSTPELGETRWSTEQGYLESYDGVNWIISTGAGEEVTQEYMQDLGNIWSLVLG